MDLLVFVCVLGVRRGFQPPMEIMAPMETIFNDLYRLICRVRRNGFGRISYNDTNENLPYIYTLYIYIYAYVNGYH